MKILIGTVLVFSIGIYCGIHKGELTKQARNEATEVTAKAKSVACDKGVCIR